MWLLVVPAVGAGLFFRFYNLDFKLFWNDEVHSTLWITGRTSATVVAGLFTSSPVTAGDLAGFLVLEPGTGLADALGALIDADPRHPPLYYGLLHLWARIFGASVTSLRAASAVASLLALPSAFWLGRELYGSPRAGWIAVAVIAVSPFYLAYAQEVREYGLALGIIMLATAALLAALRRGGRGWWLVYALAVLLGLYTYSVFAMVVVAHGAYVLAVLVRARRRGEAWKPSLIAYLTSTLIPIGFLVPWLLGPVLQHPDVAAGIAWTMREVGVLHLLGRWYVHLSAVFADHPPPVFSFPDITPVTLLIQSIGAPFLLLAGYSVYSLLSRAPLRVWLAPVTLAAVPVILVMAPDLLLGGRNLSHGRLLLPAVVGLQLAVVYLFDSWIGSPQRSKRALSAVAFGLLLVVGVSSMVGASGERVWWNKAFDRDVPLIAKTIDAFDAPIVISDTSGVSLVALSRELDPTVRFVLTRAERPVLPKEPGEVFLYRPSDKMLAQFEAEAGCKLSSTAAAELWRVNEPGDCAALDRR